MLAESPLSDRTPAENDGGLLPTDTATAALATPHGKTAATAGVPCVSLPSLTAILEHGGGMTPADVSGVCELVVGKEEVSRSQREMQVPGKVSTPATDGSEAVATGKGEPAVGLELDGMRGSTGEGVEVTATTTSERLHNELSDAPATGNETKEDFDTANVRGGLAAEEHDQLMNQGQAAPTVSFTAVSECKAVREWVRRGAYTLPTFDVTSGQRRDIR